MNWHTATVPASELAVAVGGIGLGGGTIVNCCPCDEGIRITWTTNT